MRPPRTAREGDRHGMLVIIDLLDDGSVRCRCDCGSRFRAQRADDAARMGSCGCIRRAVPKDEGSRHVRGRAHAGRTRPSYPASAVQMIRNAPRTITGVQLARLTGMTQANVSAIRRGATRNAHAIAKWLEGQRALGLITPEGAAAVERLIEDLR